jgi:hypothetical protein
MQMSTMRWRLAAICLALLLAEIPLRAIGSADTEYVGGTVNTIKEGTDGKSSAKDEKAFVFDYKGGKLTIPYDRINDLEYGQKAGRRLGLAVVVSPFFLLSHKRKHFLTVGYLDENDKQQAAVFELGKDVVRVMLTTVEARSGRKIDYQDEEARKSGLG